MVVIDRRLPIRLSFPMAQGTLPWQPILWLKLVKSDYLFVFVAIAFRNGLQYRHSDLKQFICDNLATSFKNMVNFGPVTSEFNIAKDVQPVVSFFKINRQIISGSTGTFFTKFSAYGKYLIVDY